MIVLDTSVLSAVFRRRRPPAQEPEAAGVLRKIISEDWPMAVPGIVLQELLSGVRGPDQFRSLKSHLEGFPILLATRQDHEGAAHIANTCRAAGVSTATVDCLIAAQTIAVQGEIFTLDRDFEAIAAHAKLRLFRA
ncbi:MAG: type II toxin-antitoxin system VapC family toxin [Thermoanaerobaculia bacterium]